MKSTIILSILALYSIIFCQELNIEHEISKNSQIQFESGVSSIKFIVNTSSIVNDESRISLTFRKYNYTFIYDILLSEKNITLLEGGECRIILGSHVKNRRDFINVNLINGLHFGLVSDYNLQKRLSVQLESVDFENIKGKLEIKQHKPSSLKFGLSQTKIPHDWSIEQEKYITTFKPTHFHGGFIEAYIFSKVPSAEKHIIDQKLQPRGGISDVKTLNVSKYKQNNRQGIRATGSAKLFNTPINYKIICLDYKFHAVLYIQYIVKNNNNSILQKDMDCIFKNLK